jgi:hypothetical protein
MEHSAQQRPVRKLCFPTVDAASAHELYFLAWARASATTRLKPSYVSAEVTL